MTHHNSSKARGREQHRPGIQDDALLPPPHSSVKCVVPIWKSGVGRAVVVMVKWSRLLGGTLAPSSGLGSERASRRCNAGLSGGGGEEARICRSWIGDGMKGVRGRNEEHRREARTAESEPNRREEGRRDKRGGEEAKYLICGVLLSRE